MAARGPRAAADDGPPSGPGLPVSGDADWWGRLLAAVAGLGRWCSAADWEAQIGDLPMTLRTCLVLREREGMSVGAIAALLGASPAQVRDWLFEARERLRPDAVAASGAG
jgi:hypothetical protein